MRTVDQERRLDAVHVVLIDLELIRSRDELADKPDKRHEEKVLPRRCFRSVKRSLVRSLSDDIVADERDLAEQIIKDSRKEERCERRRQHEQPIVVDYSLYWIVDNERESESQSETDDAHDIESAGVSVSRMTGKFICALKVDLLFSYKEKVNK